MKQLREVLSVFVALLDAIVMFTAPMFVIMIVICIIILLDRGGTHFRFVQKLEQEGLVATATITSEHPDESLGWTVEFADPAQAEERTVWLKESYYTPDIATTLHEGAQISIRYLPQSYENHVVLNDHFNQVQRYWGFAYDIGAIFLVSWVVVVIHPELLYIGYNIQLGQGLESRLQRLSAIGGKR